MIKRKPLWKKYPNPETAAKELVAKYGRDRAMRYARDREASFSKQSEWWHRVLNAI